MHETGWVGLRDMCPAGQIVLQVCAVNIRYVDLAAGNASEKIQAPGGSFEYCKTNTCVC